MTMDAFLEMKCKSCGGVMDKKGGYCECRYCHTRWAINFVGDEVELANAWQALKRNEFDKAAELFDEIILKNMQNAEAYWGRALATNGIVYVTDYSGQKIPTCNNITEQSFFNNKDVEKAISLASQEIKESYKKQAERIENIRVEWLEKAKKEPPYDIFISYKDSDREHGIERTQDSIDAQDLYNALVAEGYKVFFSRISLRNKIAEHYEPYIYNAIKTAKVMIVFGEKAEYFNSAWIKNEWKRFSYRIDCGEKHKHSLVVVCKNFSPSELPLALRARQCLNAEDMTFLSLLTKHVKEIMQETKSAKKIVEKKKNLEKTEAKPSAVRKRKINVGVPKKPKKDKPVDSVLSDYNLKIAEGLKVESEKRKYLKKAIKADAGNLEAHRLLVYSFLEDKALNKAIKAFERLLTCAEDANQEIVNVLNTISTDLENKTRKEIKGRVVYYAQKSENDIEDKTQSKFAVRILQYYDGDLKELQTVMKLLAEKMLKCESFDEAAYLFNLCLSLNENDAETYWRLCLAKVKAKNDYQIENSNVLLDSVPEFARYLSLVDERRRSECVRLSQNQKKNIKKAKIEKTQENKRRIKNFFKKTKEWIKEHSKAVFWIIYCLIVVIALIIIDFGMAVSPYLPKETELGVIVVFDFVFLGVFAIVGWLIYGSDWYDCL